MAPGGVLTALVLGMETGNEPAGSLFEWVNKVHAAAWTAAFPEAPEDAKAMMVSPQAPHRLEDIKDELTSRGCTWISGAALTVPKVMEGPVDA